jgi:hypothetical protein
MHEPGFSPPMAKFDDPFLTLTVEQKIDLSMIAVVRQLRARVWRRDSCPRCVAADVPVADVLNPEGGG